MKSAALLQATYDQLNNSALTDLLSSAYAPRPAIFSDVPQTLDSEDDSYFPYVVIGDTTNTPFDTKDNIGGNVILQVDLFYRNTSTIAGKAIQDAIDLRMRRTSLAITGVTHITTELEDATPTRDPDGRTTHVVMHYRVLWLT